MNPGTISPLQLDLLGGLTARLITVTCLPVALAVALLMSATHTDQVANSALQVLALATLAVACWLMFRFTDPYRLPLRRVHAVLVWSLLVIATALDVASQWGANTSIRDDWGPIAFAIVVLMTGSYRPAFDVLWLTFGASVLIFGIGVVQVLPLFESAPARFVVSPLILTMPVLATGVAAAAFSRTLVEQLLSWRAVAAAAQRDVIDDLRSGLIPSVRNERLALLNAEVVPFLRSVLALGELRAEDSDRARNLAGGLRAVMLPDAGSNWLESVADEVLDTERLAERMVNEQRGSLKALIFSLRDHLADKGAIAISLRSQETTGYLTLTAPVLDPGGLRAALAPYFVVVRSFFPHATLEIDRSGVVLELHFSLG